MLIIKDIPYSMVSIIKDLWEKNRIYHEDISEYEPLYTLNFLIISSKI